MKNFLLMVLGGATFIGLYELLLWGISSLLSTNAMYSIMGNSFVAGIIIFIAFMIITYVPIIVGGAITNFGNRAYPAVVFAILVFTFYIFEIVILVRSGMTYKPIYFAYIISFIFTWKAISEIVKKKKMLTELA